MADEVPSIALDELTADLPSLDATNLKRDKGAELPSLDANILRPDLAKPGMLRSHKTMAEQTPAERIAFKLPDHPWVRNDDSFTEIVKAIPAPEKGQERGAVAEIATGLVRGLPVASGMAYNAARRLIPAGSALDEETRWQAENAEKIAQQPNIAPTVTAESGRPVTYALAKGAEMIPMSVLPAAAATTGLGLLGLSTGAAATIGGILGAVPAGLSQSQETLDKGEEKIRELEASGTVLTDDDKAQIMADARKASYLTGAIEFGGEAVGNLLGPAKWAVKTLGFGGKVAGKTAGEVLKELATRQTVGRVVKEGLKDLGKTAASETLTEMGQGGGEAYVEGRYGFETRDEAGRTITPWQAAKDAVLPTLGMTALMAPLGVHANISQAVTRNRMIDLLSDPAQDPKTRLEAASFVYDQLAPVDKAHAEEWANFALQKVAAKEAIAFEQPAQNPEAAGEATDLPAPSGPLTRAVGMSNLPVPVSTMRVTPEGQAMAPADYSPLETVPGMTPTEIQAAQERLNGGGMAGPAVSTQNSSGPQSGSELRTQNSNELVLDEARAWAKRQQGMQRVVGESPNAYDQRVLTAYRRSQATADVPVVQPATGWGGKTIPAAPIAADSAPAPAEETPTPTKPVTSTGTKKPQNRTVDPSKDDIAVAIAKLGGIDTEAARSEWGNAITDARRDLNKHVMRQGQGFMHVFKQGGRTLDDIREVLVENGYLPPGATVNDLHAAMEDATRGTFRRSLSYDFPPPTPEVLGPISPTGPIGPSSETVATYSKLAGLDTTGWSDGERADFVKSWEKHAASKGLAPDDPALALGSIHEQAQKVTSTSSNGTAPLAGNLYVMPSKIVVEGGGRDVKRLGDLLDVETLRSKGFGALGIPSQRMVLAAMLARANDPKILDSVVGPDVIDMVNMLTGQKVSAEMLRDNPAVLKNLLAVSPDVNVSALTDPATRERLGRSIATIADLIAETPVSSLEVARAANGSAANKAGDVGASSGDTTGVGTKDLGLNLGPVSSETLSTELAHHIDSAAHDAATSPRNDLPEPTEAQKHAGNYKKGDFWLNGLHIRIENPQGSVRRGTNENGRPWETELRNHYGYIVETSQGKAPRGNDKDHLDVFVGPDPESRRVYVVDQKNIKTGRFDEHKILIGWDTPVDARLGYLANYDESGPDRIGALTETTPEGLKEWLSNGNQKKAFADSPFTIHHSQGVTDEVPEMQQEGGKGQEEVSDVRTQDDGAVPAGGVAAGASSEVSQSHVRRVDEEMRRQVDDLVRKKDIDGVLRLAFHDELTNTYNARGWQLAEKMMPTGNAVASMDISGLKWINDTFGHVYGDKLLRLIADAAEPLGIKIFRKGGDEFATIFDDPATAEKALERLAEAVAKQTIEIDGEDGTIIPYTGWRLDYGIDQDFNSADQRLNASRAEQVAAGTRNPERGGRPYSVVAGIHGEARPDSGHSAGHTAEVEPSKRKTESSEGERSVQDSPLSASSDGESNGPAADEHTPATTPASEPATAEGPETASSPAGKIEDFGEKIGGARKDTASRGTGTGPKSKKDDGAPAWQKRFIVAHSIKSPGRFGIITKGGRLSFSGTGQTFASEEEAKAAIPVYAVAMTHQAVLNPDNTWSIYKRVGERKRLKVVERSFPAREDALRYMAENAVNLLEAKTSFGEEILPVPEIAVRTGAERRTEPATAQMFMDTFAPRGIEFGNWNNQEERQQVMNHAYDGLLDLAEVLNVPPKALMLNGELAIAFGARGQGLSGAKAHYERDYGVINLTKMKGAGSLAHEWFHALDHYLGRLDSKAPNEKVANKRGDQVYQTRGPDDYLSHGASYKSQLRPELREAYKALIQAMYKKAEQYVEDTEKTEKFVGAARDNLKSTLDSLRKNLARDLTHEVTWRKNKRGLAPASAEQLAEFDRLAAILVEGGGLETQWRADNPNAPARSRAAFAGRSTNDTLEGLSAILKNVRNRSGFNAERGGTLDKLRTDMNLYAARLKMLRDAESGAEKTKQVPTSFAMEAKKMDQARSGDYWSEPHEMAARAFAAYVEDKVAEAGGQSDFLVYHAHGGILVPMIDGFVARPYPEGKEREAIGKAFDEFVGTLQTREKGTALFALRDANSRYNDDLDRMKTVGLPHRHIFDLGEPGEILRSVGVPSLPIKMNLATVHKVTGQGESARHELPVGLLYNLPRHINNPVAVFASDTQANAKTLLLQMRHEGKPVMAALHLEVKTGNIEVNRIASVYERNEREYVNWTIKGLLEAIDKTKGQWLLEQVRRAIRPRTSGSLTPNKILYHRAEEVKSGVREDGTRFAAGAASEGLDHVAIDRIQTAILAALPEGATELRTQERIVHHDPAAFAAHGVTSGTIAGMTQMTARQTRAIVTLALEHATEATGYHEVFHAAKMLGLIDKRDAALLERAFPARDGRDSEERTADAFGRYGMGQTRPVPGIRRIWDRILNWLKRVGNALREMGFRTADDVFADLWGGKLKGRQAADAFERSGDRSLAEVILDRLREKGISDEEILRAASYQPARYAAAWHGSPHDFDKFSQDKIGTGEGAQSYGHGLYFAGKKEVAEHYRDTLGPGRGLEVGETAARIYQSLPAEWSEDRKTVAVINELQHRADGAQSVEFKNKMQREIRAVEQGKHRGRLYQVELAPKEDEYLLWDKPLAEQSETVKAALKNEFDALREYYKNPVSDPLSMSGGEFYRGLSDDGDRAASDYLHSLGVRGIKYLNGASRSAGEGDYNYVIFSDKDVSITAKYALREEQAAEVAAGLEPMAVLKSMGRFLNPFDFSRLRKFVEEHTEPATKDNIAWLLQEPFSRQEQHEAVKPFYEEGKRREEDRFTDAVRMKGGLAEKGPEADGGGMDNLREKFRNFFDWSDMKTVWEETKQRMYDPLSREEKAAFDVLVFEGDARNVEYGSFEKALLNPKVKAAGLTERTFAFYRKLIEAADTAFEEGLKLEEELMRENGIDPQKIADTIAGKRSRYKGELDYRFEKVTEGKKEVFRVSLGYDPGVNVLHQLKRVAKKFDTRVTQTDEGVAIDFKARDEEAARADLKYVTAQKRRGYIHRNHGEGEMVVTAHHVIDRLDFTTRDVTARDGKPAAQFYLNYYPGLTLAKEIEQVADDLGGSFRQQEGSGHIILQFRKEEEEQARERLAAIPLTRPDGSNYRVMVYSRYVPKESKAKKLAQQVRRDPATFMPVGYLEGHTYEVNHKQSDSLQEDEYQDITANSFALDRMIDQALKRATNRGEIGEKAAEELRKDYQTNVAEILMARGAGMYNIRRADYLIEGYDRTDALGKFESYVHGVAGMLSKARYARRQFEHLQAVPAEHRRWASRYVRYTLRNLGRWDRLSGDARAAVSLWYLGGNVSWMLINSTQPYVVGVAELSKHIAGGAFLKTDGQKGALRRIAAAEFDVLRDKLSDDERNLFADPRVQVQFKETALAEMTGSDAGVGGKASRALHGAVRVTMAPGQKVEQLNRKTVILASYRVFRAQGMARDEAVQKALAVNDAVNIDMGRHNLPGYAAHSALGRGAYALQSYITHMLNLIYYRTTSGNRADQKALVRLFFAMYLLGGAAAGAPGLDELDKFILKLFGYSPKLAFRNWLRKNARNYGGPAEALFGFVADVHDHGLPGALFGVSLTGAVQLRIPLLSNWLAGDDVTKSVTGPIGGLAQKGVKAGAAAWEGDWSRAAEYAAPTAAANVVSAVRQTSGPVTTTHGKEVFYRGQPVRMTSGEGMLRAFGMQPARVSDLREDTQIMKELEAYGNAQKMAAQDRYRKYGDWRGMMRFNNLRQGAQWGDLVTGIDDYPDRGVADEKDSQWQYQYGR